MNLVSSTDATLSTAAANATQHKSIPSLIKWTGSKRSQARAIAAHIPPYERYFEPFLGSGAVLFLAATPGSVAGDLYPPLIALWRQVQQSPQQVITNYAHQWQALQGDLPDYYYQVRQRFNQSQDPLDLSFLMRTCVNGIARFNRQGEFNNSFHLSRKGMKPAHFESVVRTWHRRLNNVRFLCQDYEALLADANPGDFVYLDPPYAGNKQRYVANLDPDRFYGALESLNSRGVRWALSFDGKRGGREYRSEVPPDLYQRKLQLISGNSAVSKVLNGPVEPVTEALYLSY